MNRTKWHIFIGIILSILVGCTPTPGTDASKTPEITTPSFSTLNHIVISELLTGIENNNNHDFIELYNPQYDAVDLAGYSLVYQLDQNTDAVVLYQWEAYTLIPAFGYYLLGYDSEDFGIAMDASFKQNLIPNKGYLALLDDNGKIRDSLCWGKQVCENTEGQPASPMTKGKSLERLPGGSDGSVSDTENNAADFVLNTQPAPQNSGSPTIPAIASKLQIDLKVPAKVNPGEQFSFIIQVTNPANEAAENIEVILPIPDGILINDTQDPDILIEPPFATWRLPTLGSEETKTLSLAVTAPWSYTNLLAHSYSATADGLTISTVGAPTSIEVAEGSVPIEIAKTLFDVDVVVEGIATMYTDGFYAGSSGTKFYLRDESGSVQVYVPGGKGSVNVNIGDHVRVQGHIELYRGALELIPAVPEYVEIIARKENSPLPIEIPIADALQSEPLHGELVTIQGNAARIEEFSYSFEMDFLDENGQMITAYIDKETQATIETLENERLYNVTGILEVRDGNVQINPRQQSDIKEIPPAALAIEIDAPSNVEQKNKAEIIFTITNNLPEDANAIQLTMPLSLLDYEVLELSDGGQIIEDSAFWELPFLPASNNKPLTAVISVTSQKPYFEIKDYTLVSENAPDLITGAPHYIFTTPTIPIWAIQGPGDRSPYLMQIVQTQGVVTAVFPDLNGFWMQEIQTDSDPLTSAGIFVSTEDLGLEIATGDQIEVKGLVREVYQQTQLTLSTKNDVVIVRSGGRLPNPVTYDPPQDEAEALIYNEALEGMLVSVRGSALAVSPISKYGEVTLVLPKHNADRLYQGQPNGHKITLDDGSSTTHLEQDTLPFVINTGDTVSNITGPLAFTYGNYKIELTKKPAISNQPIETRQLPEVTPGQFSIMTWNVENLFDFLEPHPSSPALPNIRQYKVDIARTANTILAAGAPTMIALQEVENIDVLEDIAESEVLSPYVYEPILIEGTDSRGIDVGYLVRTDQVALLETIQHEAPEGITSRPPLEIALEINSTNPPTKLHLLNNHFTSMSGGEKATEPRRNSQAAWNVTVMEGILDIDPASNIIVTGDLNSYYNSPPIDILRAGELFHAFDLLESQERYTYIYEGVSQTLDHVMMTEWLYENIDSVTVLHTNADYTIPLAGDESTVRKSDHDPVIVVFTIAD